MAAYAAYQHNPFTYSHWMPRRKNRKRGRRRQGRQGRTSDAVPKSLGSVRFSGTNFQSKGGFPPVVRMRLAWTATFQNTNGTAPVIDLIWANSPYQPCTGINMRSAFQFSSWTAFYKYHRVFRSTITVEAILSNTQANVTTVGTPDLGGLLAVAPMNNSTFSGSIADIAQNPGGRMVDYSSVRRARVRMSHTSKSITGEDPSTEPNRWGSTAAHPSVGWFWCIGVNTMGAYSTGAQATPTVTVRVEYDVEFFGYFSGTQVFEENKGDRIPEYIRAVGHGEADDDRDESDGLDGDQKQLTPGEKEVSTRGRRAPRPRSRARRRGWSSGLSNSLSADIAHDRLAAQYDGREHMRKAEQWRAEYEMLENLGKLHGRKFKDMSELYGYYDALQEAKRHPKDDQASDEDWDRMPGAVTGPYTSGVTSEVLSQAVKAQLSGQVPLPSPQPAGKG